MNDLSFSELEDWIWFGSWKMKLDFNISFRDQSSCCAICRTNTPLHNDFKAKVRNIFASNAVEREIGGNHCHPYFLSSTESYSTLLSWIFEFLSLKVLSNCHDGTISIWLPRNMQSCLTEFKFNKVGWNEAISCKYWFICTYTNVDITIIFNSQRDWPHAIHGHLAHIRTVSCIFSLRKYWIDFHARHSLLCSVDFQTK